MTLLTLPDVLVQSLMHALQPREILSLARCCKWTLECADSAFAWRDCPPLDREWPQLHASLPAALSRLSRFIPVAIVPEDNSLTNDDADRLLTVMQSRLCIIRLQWLEWKLPVQRGLQLLAHPCMQSVRDLGLAMGMRAQWLAAVAVLPSLTKLNLVFSYLGAADLEPLVHARALRELHVSEAGQECLSLVMLLHQLTILSICVPRINGHNFVAFCAAMSRLEKLGLQSWTQERVRSISPADLVTGFSSLRCLRSLILFTSFDEETLAPVLHFAPALRVLTLPDFTPAHKPTFIARMRQVAPLLEVQLD